MQKGSISESHDPEGPLMTVADQNLSPIMVSFFVACGFPVSVQLCGCFSSGPMLVPSLPFPIDLIHWHKPIKGNFPCEPTKSTKCNLILVYFNMHASTRNPDDPGCTAHLDMDSPFLGSRWNSSSTSLAEIHCKVYSE